MYKARFQELSISLSVHSIKGMLSVQILGSPAFTLNYLPPQKKLGCKIQQFKVTLNTHTDYIPAFFQSKPFSRPFAILCVSFNYLVCSFFLIPVCLAFETKSNGPDGTF